MKFLVTGDVHIRNYSKFTKWTTVIPERLQINLDLARDIVKVAKDNKVDNIIIAGDLLDIAISPPMVLNTVNDFLGILSNQCDVFFTHGQHDISTKTIDEYLKQLTSLSIFESDKVKFYHDEVINIADTSIFFYGWSNVPPEFKDADIFIGHSMVIGSKNNLNYTFQSGYDPEVLSNKYKFSVIGDIHKSQSFFDNVLIPGPPIQNSFKDDSNTGVWIIDTEDWSYKFCALENPLFPKFYYVEDKSTIPVNKPDNHFYQVLSSVRNKKTSDKIVNSSISLDLWGAIENTIDTIKDNRHDLLKKLSRKIYEDALLISVETRNIPSVIITSLKISNFFSIKDVDIEIPVGTVSITGDIGSGKTTFLEAICWGLYGITTKGKFKDDLIPLTYKPEGEVSVEIQYSIGENKYKISRTLNKLEFYINDAAVSGSRIQDTQQIIEDTIQLSFSEFSCLVYFSQEAGSFFGNLKNNQQMALMTMFLNQQDQYLDKMINLASSSYKKYMEESLKIVGAISNLATLNERNLHKYNEIKSYQVSLRDRQIQALEYSKYNDCSMDVIDLLIQDKVIDAINLYFKVNYQHEKEELEKFKDMKNELSTRKINAEIQLSKNKSQLNSNNNKIQKLAKQVQSYKFGTCPECKQTLPVNNEHLKAIVEEIKTLKMENSNFDFEISTLVSKIDEYQPNIVDYENKILNISNMLSKCEDFKKYRKFEINVDISELNVLEKAISEYEEHKTDLESQHKSFEELRGLYEILHKKVFNDKAVKSKCVEYIGQYLSSEVNSMLESIDSNIRLTINTVTYNKSGGLSSGFDVLANFNGVNINYRNASGGQKMLIDISAMVSLYNLISAMYNLPEGLFGLLALDESVKYLDSKNIDTVKDLISCVRAKSIFVISHDDKLSALLSDRVLNVKMETGISKYKLY